MFGALNDEVLGSHTEAEWQELVQAWGWRCFYCGHPVCNGSMEKKRQLTRDHLIPLSTGGTNFIWNIAPACIKCNQLKGNLTVEEFREARPQICKGTQEKSTGIAFVRTTGISSFGLQSVDYLSPKLSMARLFDAQARRRLLAEQTEMLRHRQLSQAGQLPLDFTEVVPLIFNGMDLGPKAPVSDRRALLEKQLAEIQQKRQG